MLNPRICHILVYMSVKTWRPLNEHEKKLDPLLKYINLSIRSVGHENVTSVSWYLPSDRTDPIFFGNRKLGILLQQDNLSAIKIASFSGGLPLFLTIRLWENKINTEILCPVQ